MALLFLSQLDRAAPWQERLRRHLPDLDVRLWPDAGDADAITMALVFQPPAGALKRFSNLKAIFSLGAGVDGILVDPQLPDVPVCRMVDRRLTASMAEYILLATLRVHRGFDMTQQAQAARRWQFQPPIPPEEFTVGFLGLGELGSAAALKLSANGYRVLGWSRRPKTVEGIVCHSGEGGLDPVLSAADLIVCLLPATPATDGILNRNLFRRMKPGAHLVNVGRGAHLVEDDLIPALDEGLLSGATLDVFQEEPLPAEHPFWGDLRICITPHLSGFTDPETAVELVVENIRRLQDGRPLLHVVDRGRGY